MWRKELFYAFLSNAKVEINTYARSVLRSRINEGFLHPGQIWEDVTEFKASPETEAEGCGGGFPCQAGQSLQRLQPLHHLVFLVVLFLSQVLCEMCTTTCCGKSRSSLIVVVMVVVVVVVAVAVAAAVVHVVVDVVVVEVVVVVVAAAAAVVFFVVVVVAVVLADVPGRGSAPEAFKRGSTMPAAHS